MIKIKKVIILSFILFISNSIMLAQSSKIVCSVYKKIEYKNNSWSNWPTSWSYYSSEGKLDFIYRITILEEGEYGITQYRGDKILNNFKVRYDRELSNKIRKDWEDDTVHCYREVALEWRNTKIDPRDYICIRNASLQSIVFNSSIWENEKTQLYFMLYSNNVVTVTK